MTSRKRRKRPPWYHRISPITWTLLWLLLAASASLAFRTARNASAIPTSAQIQVLNGTGVPELARSVATRLRDRGLDVADDTRQGRTAAPSRVGVVLDRENHGLEHPGYRFCCCCSTVDHNEMR